MYLCPGLGAATSSSLVSGIAAAIQQMEGWFPGSISYKNNNPGNLRSGAGMTGTSGGYAVFPDLATGEAALDAQIQTLVNQGLTLQEFFAGNKEQGGTYPGYAPAADSNNPTAYANYVASQVGIDTSTPLNSIDASSGAAALSASTDSNASTDSTDSSAGSSSGIDLSGVSSALSGVSPVVWAAVGVGVVGLLVWATA